MFVQALETFNYLTGLNEIKLENFQIAGAP